MMTPSILITIGQQLVALLETMGVALSLRLQLILALVRLCGLNSRAS
ncbi:hypothetical protein LINPERPRIM_LOCUS23857 [Linum perenne]